MSETDSIETQKQDDISKYIDESILAEDYKTENLFNLKDSFRELRSTIDEVKKSCLIGIVGPYGSGKSTMVHNFIDKKGDRKSEKDRARENEIYINFDAWQFPDRHELWRGLIFTVIDEITKEILRRDLENGISLIKRMFGSKEEVKGSFERILTGAAAVVGADKFIESVDAASKMEEKDFITAGLNISCMPPELYGYRKDFSNVIKRVIEEFNRSIDEINKSKKEKDKISPISRIIIVLEDTDRCGEAGIHFLETLSHFLKNEGEGIGVEMVGLVLLGKQSYQNIKQKEKKIYDKILEGSIDFRLQGDIFVQFLNSLFKLDTDIDREGYKKLFNLFSSYLKEKYPSSDFTLRQVKKTFRDICNLHRGINDLDNRGHSNLSVFIKKILLIFVLEDNLEFGYEKPDWQPDYFNIKNHTATLEGFILKVYESLVNYPLGVNSRIKIFDDANVMLQGDVFPNSVWSSIKKKKAENTHLNYSL